MKKSYLKLIIFSILLIIIVLLNNFILNILGTYWRLSAFLLLSIIAFKLIFGLEKDNHRYTKDILFNIIIIYLISFIAYYLFGLLIGFVRTEMQYSFYGLTTFVLPFIIMITLKEFLRYQMVTKAEKSRMLIILVTTTFVVFDTIMSQYLNFNSKYTIFMFIAITLLPAISNNIAATYIARRIGYKPNILWLAIAGLYYSLLPIVPNSGVYVGAMIKFLFPVVIAYNVYNFFSERGRQVPIRNNKKELYLNAMSLTLLVTVLVYFTSGYFRFHAIAVATGSMTPNIMKGDVVVIDKKVEAKNLKVGQVLAHKYDSKIIVHRIVDIVNVGGEYYIYTQGDANNAKDDYVIYENMIVGVVNIKIPYAGFPTVWLNEL